MRINRNNTNAFSEISLKVKALSAAYREEKETRHNNGAPDQFLHEHQFITSEFLSQVNLGTHGMLIMHGLGTGKTILAASSALKLQNRFSKIVFMAPKSLHDNFANSLEAVSSGIGIVASRPIEYISFGSSKMESLSDLSNTLLIIDEAHNFVRGVINGTKRASIVYKAILSSTGNWTLFFTGTPITKHPFDVVPFINAITKSSTLPEDISHFEDLFMKFSTDGDPTGPKKSLQFCDRLLGLVSCKETSVANTTMYPAVRPLMVIEIEMGEKQAAVYSRIKEHEDRANSRVKFGQRGRPSSLASVQSKRASSSSCYAKSRMASNGVKSGTGAVCSTKITAVVAFLMERSTRPCIVYSQFLEYGLLPLLDQLKAAGEPACEIMSGKASADERADVERRFNSNENVNGKVIRFLLLSAVGAEGLNLHRVQYAIALEPYWLNTRLIQFFGRGVRPFSHADLPEGERWLQPVVFVSVVPDKQVESIEKTMFIRGTRMMHTIHRFERLLKTVSIECALYKEEEEDNASGCHACIPDGKPLFTNDLVGDVKQEKSPCSIVAAKQQHTGRELFYKGVRYVEEKMATDDSAQEALSSPSRFFKYNKSTNFYEPVSEGSLVYSALSSLSGNVEYNRILETMLEFTQKNKGGAVILVDVNTASDSSLDTAKRQYPIHCIYKLDTYAKIRMASLMVGLNIKVALYSDNGNFIVIET
ncbi:MAG TPA: helicase-related protein [Nitrospiraceae bacterium]|nr:helicase-related protein [Nitrospiraceae bacterium]